MTTHSDALRRLCRDNGVLDQDSSPMIAKYLSLGELTADDHQALTAMSAAERSGVLALRYGSDTARLADMIPAQAAQ